MGSIGVSEVLIVLVVALIVLGPQRLPEAARQVGRFLGEARRITSGFQAEIKEALDEPLRVPQEQVSRHPDEPDELPPGMTFGRPAGDPRREP